MYLGLSNEEINIGIEENENRYISGRKAVQAAAQIVTICSIFQSVNVKQSAPIPKYSSPAVTFAPDFPIAHNEFAHVLYNKAVMQTNNLREDILALFGTVADDPHTRIEEIYKAAWEAIVAVSGTIFVFPNDVALRYVPNQCTPLMSFALDFGRYKIYVLGDIFHAMYESRIDPKLPNSIIDRANSLRRVMNEGDPNLPFPQRFDFSRSIWDGASGADEEDGCNCSNAGCTLMPLNELVGKLTKFRSSNSLGESMELVGVVEDISGNVCDPTLHIRVKFNSVIKADLVFRAKIGDIIAFQVD